MTRVPRRPQCGYSANKLVTRTAASTAVALFETQRHEPLTEAPWDERRARDAIARIVADTHIAFTEHGLWPIHPIDRSPERADVLKPIYYGAAGVIWALYHLHADGFTAVRRDYRSALGRLLETHRADSLRLVKRPILGYPTGDAGILLLQWTLSPTDALARELYNVIESNLQHPSLGFGWGSPGSMLAAQFMFERTDEPSWRDLWLRLFDEIWRTWTYDDALDCHLWMQDLYGVRERRIGALHGFAGNVFCMLKGRSFLSATRALELERRANRTLHATALREGSHANWLLAAETAGNERPALRIQHCIGAPGMITCLASLPHDVDTDQLLLAAGELTWSAGPPVKLPSLCHGTPGSGYAFLKLARRTGRDEWLMRARRFAMHAIEQGERFTAQHGQRKFSLWTGDLGLAVFLSDCVRANDAFPTLDVF